MAYSQIQWLIVFYLYCFAGWIWETFYVSIRRHKWVNRGFLHGPWLPIYGIGAVWVLFATLPAVHNTVLVFFIGMISATILEYVTGAAMERIFHMRYWDYSEKPFNVHGYICLPVSIAWGFFSLFLIYILHPPVDRIIHAFSGWQTDTLGIILTVLFTADVTKSVQEALDLKALLAKLTDSDSVISRLDTKLDSITEKLPIHSGGFRERLSEIEAAKAELLERHHQHQAEKNLSRKEFLLKKLNEHRTRKSRILSFAEKKASLFLEEAVSQLNFAANEQEREHLQRVTESLSEFIDSIRNAKIEVAARKDRDFQQAVSILERNPSARSKKYHQAVTELKNLKSKKQKKDKDN